MADGTFDSPVPVTGGTSYVASTFMPSGHYSVASAFFTSPVVNSPLTGTLGTYSYGADTFPSSSLDWQLLLRRREFTRRTLLRRWLPSKAPTDPCSSSRIPGVGDVCRGIEPASLQMSVKDATNTRSQAQSTTTQRRTPRHSSRAGAAARHHIYRFRAGQFLAGRADAIADDWQFTRWRQRRR